MPIPRHVATVTDTTHLKRKHAQQGILPVTTARKLGASRRLVVARLGCPYDGSNRGNSLSHSTSHANNRSENWANTFKQGILLTAIADTEAQTSYVGPDLMHMLNLKQRELSKSVQEGQFLWSVLV